MPIVRLPQVPTVDRDLWLWLERHIAGHREIYIFRKQSGTTTSSKIQTLYGGASRRYYMIGSGEILAMIANNVTRTQLVGLTKPTTGVRFNEKSYIQVHAERINGADWKFYPSVDGTNYPTVMSLQQTAVAGNVFNVQLLVEFDSRKGA